MASVTLWLASFYFTGNSKLDREVNIILEKCNKSHIKIARLSFLQIIKMIK